MAIRRYSKREPQVFLWVVLPYIFFLNMLVFGTCIFRSASAFARSFLFSGIYIILVYFVFGLAAMLIQKRFPSAGDMFRRIAIMLPMFYFMNAIAITGLFQLFNQWPLMPCPTKPGMLLWTIMYACIMSTFITFINEGVVNWEAWKTSITETERLKNVYQRSRVLGLKGQINPHFLFNCFNTLSGLIQEDESKAEKFLDEMTKVHRYLLRSDDELLVSLESEMKFANSYLYLARERFGEAIQVTVEIEKDSMEKLLPPLSLQVILENIVNSNALNKTNPLRVKISSRDARTLSVVNTLHDKLLDQSMSQDDGLCNLVEKYKILNERVIVIQEDGEERALFLPLFDKNEVII